MSAPDDPNDPPPAAADDELDPRAVLRDRLMDLALEELRGGVRPARLPLPLTENVPMPAPETRPVPENAPGLYWMGVGSLAAAVVLVGGTIFLTQRQTAGPMAFAPKQGPAETAELSDLEGFSGRGKGGESVLSAESHGGSGAGAPDGGEAEAAADEAASVKGKEARRRESEEAAVDRLERRDANAGSRVAGEKSDKSSPTGYVATPTSPTPHPPVMNLPRPSAPHPVSATSGPAPGAAAPHGRMPGRPAPAEAAPAAGLEEMKRLKERELSLRARKPMDGKKGEAAKDFDRQAHPGEPFDALAPADPQADTPTNEAYQRPVENPFEAPAKAPLSTFSIDVDTAGYANVRRYLTQNRLLPPADAVRLEEMVNYFPYDYAAPQDEKHPFAANFEVAACPWAPTHRLVRIGLKGREIALDKRPLSNLVFLLDVSGSMGQPNKLPLLLQSFRMLVDKLGENDRVAIVVYAGASGLVLPSTPGNRKTEILDALDRLQAGGSTNGGAGIELAYQVAVDNFIRGGTNRVILASDGDFNVGTTSVEALEALIRDKAKTGVFLSVLGFGEGNFKDATMERLADRGNGNYNYIDSIKEGRKVLVEQMSGTLLTIAKDVKIQVEFNPAQVKAYRLLGYENRMLAAQDFNDDTKDAGEIGAGHTVTAFYEVIPAGSDEAIPGADGKPAGTDPLKYQTPAPAADAAPAVQPNEAVAKELLTVKVKYKQPDASKSEAAQEFPLVDGGKTFAQASQDFKFGAAVADFALVLQESRIAVQANLDLALELAQTNLGKDEGGYRAEFLELVKQAKAIKVGSAGK